MVALDVIDDCSRAWVASHVAPAQTIDAAITAIDKAVVQWGTPGMVLADNGSAFAHKDRVKDKTLTSRFSRTVTARHGSRMIHSSAYHPQTLGKCERLHQTADKLLNHYYPSPRPRPRNSSNVWIPSATTTTLDGGTAAWTPSPPRPGPQRRPTAGPATCPDKKSAPTCSRSANPPGNRSETPLIRR
ncbi:hypothetical protein ACWDKQ_01460 [Saccharopolyspora sp. NPDC000995]